MYYKAKVKGIIIRIASIPFGDVDCSILVVGNSVVMMLDFPWAAINKVA